MSCRYALVTIFCQKSINEVMKIGAEEFDQTWTCDTPALEALVYQNCSVWGYLLYIRTAQFRFSTVHNMCPVLVCFFGKPRLWLSAMLSA